MDIVARTALSTKPAIVPLFGEVGGVEKESFDEGDETAIGSRRWKAGGAFVGTEGASNIRFRRKHFSIFSKIGFHNSVVLSGHGDLAGLLIMEAHAKVAHLGYETTLAKLREQYHLL